jgi:DNA-binding transcriptional MerR regulator
MVSGLTTSQAARLAGLPYATVDYWDRTGFLSPSLVQANGKGSDRVYSFADLVALRVARELRKGGMSFQAVRRVVAYLRSRDDLASPLTSCYLVTDGVDVYERRGDEMLSVLRRPGQGSFLFLLDLAATVEELTTAMAELRRVA